MRIALILALTLFAACTPMPALEGRIGAEARAAPFPALVPIETLLAQAASSGGALGTPDFTGGIPARLAALAGRARALRQPVMNAAERARLARGIDIGALQ